ncbi:MAG: membrane protein insertase YidC [Cytophagales bacterium]
MKDIDRNQAIGLVLISAMLIAYFTFFSGPSAETKTTKPATDISDTSKKANTTTLAAKSSDTTQLKKQFGTFASFANGTETEYILENENLKVTLSSKGGTVKHVLLKNYKTYSKEDLYLIKSSFNTQRLIAFLPTGKINLNELYYSSSKIGNTVSFVLPLAENQFVSHSYTLPEKSFELTYNIEAKGIENLIQGDKIELTWNQEMPLTEKDLTASRTTANITYRLNDGTYNSLSETKLELQEAKLESKVNWITFKQKFFSVGLISENGFASGEIKSETDINNPLVVKSVSANLNLKVADLTAEKGKFKYYFGPNKLNLMADVAPSFNENVYLGWPIINNINRYTIAPLFSFLEKFIGNYGVIIIAMVLIIKLILLPLSFQAYKSMAKIKVLKPELDDIKARAGDDMTVQQQEQMKLYQQVGINPLAGCIPVLLQMPVLLAMFNFFPNAIEFRQQSFLWAEDLSTFDTIATLPFSIPFYGDHVSLFTILMTASTILYTWYNSQMQVSATGPMIAMSYIMPVVFMFVMNSFPAGLSFYYFVSNMITVGQQFLIKSFVNEDDIRAKLEDNKKKLVDKKPNRFQQRLQAAMEQQQELKKKPTKK